MLHIKNLSICTAKQEIVKNSTFSIEQGKITTMIGESGSGKSLTLLAILGMLPETMHAAGEVLFKNKNILNLSVDRLKNFRRTDVFVVFQDAFNSFNPSIKIGRQLFSLAEQPIPKEYSSFVKNMKPILTQLRLPDDVIEKYPFELSGGMLQRCMIACALYRRPSLIIADEPTSGLDHHSQQELITILKDMNRKLGTTILLITHNIDVVKEIAHQVAVMLQGTIIESGPAEIVLCHPAQSYTKRLLKSSFRMKE